MTSSRTILTAILAALGLAAATASATPLALPTSAIGTNETIQIVAGGHPGSYDLNGGGAFQAIVDGFSTYVFCVDIDNSVNVPDTFQGNVTNLGDWTNGQNSEVRKGTYSNSSWQNSSLGGVSNLTPMQRYQVAAYLLAQEGLFQNLTQGADDQALQNAIWYVTDARGGTTAPGLTALTSSYISNAVAYVLAHPSFGDGQFVVISGAVRSDGSLLCNNRKQTFLAFTGSQVPEPGSYALMGLGLGALAFARRRKA